jgi:hypothetical protein
VGMSGDVFVGGNFRVSLEDPGDSSSLSSAGLEDVFVMRLNGVNGSTIWKRRFGGPGDDRANSVAADSDDNVYVTGTYQGAMDVGADHLQSAGLGDVFVFKLAGSGDPAWSHGFGGAGDDDGYGLAIDFNNDELVVAGGMNGTVDFGSGFELTSRARDGFVARYGIDGSGPNLVRRFGGDDEDTIFDVAVDGGAGNQIVVVGSFRGTVDFGGPSFVLTSNGEDDTFVLALAP